MTYRSTTAVAGGFTLIEVMTATALLMVFFGAAFTLGLRATDGNRRHAGYTSDLVECRAVLAAFERDVRASLRIDVDDDGCTTVLTDRAVRYRHEGRKVLRVDGEHSQTLARSIAAFEVALEGHAATLTLTLAKRDPRARREAVIATTVCPRLEAQR